MKKRERIVIIHDILKAVQQKKDARPTHILYKSNLSSQMLKEYLQELLDKEFIEEHETKRAKTYRLTERGHKYLEDFNTIRNFMESYDLDE
jgi:predicted transcriptional regulator